MHREEHQLTAHRAGLRLGGACAIVGSPAVFGFRLAHGDPPAADPEAALRFISEHPAYAGVHLGTNLGVLVWVAGFTALSGSLAHTFASLLGRWGATTVLLGAASYSPFAAPPSQAQVLAAPGYSWATTGSRTTIVG